MLRLLFVVVLIISYCFPSSDPAHFALTCVLTVWYLSLQGAYSWHEKSTSSSVCSLFEDLMPGEHGPQRTSDE